MSRQHYTWCTHTAKELVSYLNMLAVNQPTYCQIKDWWTMNWNRYGRKWCGLTQNTVPTFAWRDWGNSPPGQPVSQDTPEYKLQKVIILAKLLSPCGSSQSNTINNPSNQETCDSLGTGVGTHNVLHIICVWVEECKCRCAQPHPFPALGTEPVHDRHHLPLQLEHCKQQPTQNIHSVHWLPSNN